MTAQPNEQRKHNTTSTITSQEGATAIEFAIVLPLLLLLVFGITEFCILIYESSVLEGALNSASRLGRTGFPDITNSGNPGGSRWNAVLNVMQTQTSGLLNPSKIELNATAYLNFTSVGQSGQGVAQSLGGGNDVVVYTASYPYPPMFFLQRFVGKNPMIQVSDIVKNEPFNVAPPTTPCTLPASECGTSPTPTPTPPVVTPTPTPKPSTSGGSTPGTGGKTGTTSTGSSSGTKKPTSSSGNGNGSNGGKPSSSGSSSTSSSSSSSGGSPSSSGTTTPGSSGSSGSSSGSSGGGTLPCSPVC